MAFRDDREALRQRIQELREEAERLAKQRDDGRAALAEIHRDFDERVRAAMRKGTRIPLLVAAGVLTPLVVIFAVGFLAPNCGGSGVAEMLFGNVTVATGEAPVPQGTPCTVFIRGGGDDWDIRMNVLCGGRTVYGGGSKGYMDCDRVDSVAVSCADSDYTADGGDPRVSFDRGSARLVIEDQLPDWRLEIALSPPPAPPGGG